MNIVQDLTNKLQRNRILSAIFILLSLLISGVLVSRFIFTDSLFFSIISGLILCLPGVGFFIQQGWFKKPSPSLIVRFLDRNYPFMEESSSLFVRTPKTTFESWQLEKIQSEVKNHQKQIQLPNRILIKSAVFSIGILFFSTLIGFALKNSFQEISSDSDLILSEQNITNNPEERIPAIQNIEITITPPRYTNLPAETKSFENISIAENAELKWTISANQATDSVWIKFGNQSSLNLEPSGLSFEGELLIRNNQIYQIGIANSDTTIFTDYRAISVIDDSPPQFIVDSPRELRSMVSPVNREFDLDVEIIDDYEVADAFVQATLARGSGENVRFRERTLHFDTISGLNRSQARGNLKLNVDSLEMEPGDELYFYIEAVDNRPNPQSGRSETYFVIYQDSTEAETAPFGSIAVDLMPEYFRSQRQIIIDTEELLEDKPNITEQEFKQRSNTIGQNQALLRLRYGEYLGLEDESGGMSSSISSNSTDESETADHEHDHQHEEDINEQGLARSESEAAAITPEEFLHDHGAAEMNTLYADSPRAMLKESLANMWDAELYLRTHRPETALPYEYRALELLKQVQQANRQYVRKVGYELSPIPVDETRLTGTYDDFVNPGEEFSSDSEKSALAKLELMIREENVDNIEQATNWVQQAEISDADRLFILNRLRQITEEGFTEEIKKNLLERITGIENNRVYDPAPAARPILGALPENE